jgi:uncharacterized phage protein gp47/JayE
MTITIASITAAGVSAPPFSQTLSELQNAYYATFGVDTYLGNDSQDGQMVAIFAQAISDANNAVVNTYNAFSPTTAQGTGLSSVVKLNGLARLTPTNSTAICTITGQVGTLLTNAQAQDSGGNYWNIPITTIPSSGSILVTVTCAALGAILAPAGTINIIATPTLGWQSITNPAAATAGAPVEIDANLRIRQSNSVAMPGQAIIDAISAAIGNVAGVTKYIVYENATSVTDVNGVPAHSISPIVEGGTITAIATAIQSRKPPGIQTYGTTSSVVIDPVGLPITINYYTLAETNIYISLTLHPLAGYVSSTGTLVINALVTHITALTIGGTVYYSKLYGPANLQGQAAVTSSGLTQTQLNLLNSTYTITALTIGTAPSPVGTVDITIPFNAEANIVSSNVVLSTI